jgi:3-oxoacyl-[acyl-carrier-protein] synthase-1
MSLMPLPITGFNLCNSLGANRAEVRDALFEGRHGLTPNTLDLPFETVVGALDVALPELPAEVQPWSTRSARVAALLLGDLERPLRSMRERWRPERIGILMGTSTAGADVTEAAYGEFVQKGSLPEGYDLWRHHTYGATLEVVRHLTGAQGPAWMHSTACTSSAKPLASARRLIRAGILDAAIVGGIDTLCAMTLSGFHCLGALSGTACRPFGAGRTGINIGEGGAILLIERSGDGEALLEAVGESSDAYHISAPHPQGLGATLAMRRALEEAGCSAGDVGHINAHGTGTPLNDSAESLAIAEVFGLEVPVVSPKSYTGHTLGAAGATEAAISLFSILEGWAPASLRVDPKDDKVAVNVICERTSGTYRRVLSNSFAFGGNNVSVLLGAA